jgi:hypothetical protein
MKAIRLPHLFNNTTTTTMNTLEAFVFANETASFEAIAKIWNKLHHTNLTAEKIKAISAEINLRAHKISF